MKKYIIFLLMLCFAISYAQQNDIKTLIAKAEQGNAEAQNNLGIAYYNGENVEKSYEKAVSWFSKAAEQGNAEAQFSLGHNGEGVKKSREKAVYWYTLSAEQGYVRAQNNLGSCYFIGDGVKQSYEKAVY